MIRNIHRKENKLNHGVFYRVTGNRGLVGFRAIVIHFSVDFHFLFSKDILGVAPRAPSGIVLAQKSPLEYTPEDGLLTRKHGHPQNP